MLQVKIRVLSLFNQARNGFVTQVHRSTAFFADHLELIGRTADNLILGSCFTSLARSGAHDSGVAEQLQRVIHCSDRYMFRFAGGEQLFRREGLLETERTTEYDIPHFGRPFVVVAQIAVESLQCTVI